MSSTETAKRKKQTHCVIRNSNLFCTHCGREQVLPYPLQPEMFSAMGKAFEKIHKGCKKTWQEGITTPEMNETQKMNWWLANGEHGLSSKSIYSVISGTNIMSRGYGYYTPSDPSDFNRCYKLIKAIPEWRDKLVAMKEISPVWGKIVDNWDKLSEYLEDQMKTNKANGMYEFMKSLGC